MVLINETALEVKNAEKLAEASLLARGEAIAASPTCRWTGAVWETRASARIRKILA